MIVSHHLACLSLLKEQEGRSGKAEEEEEEEERKTNSSTLEKDGGECKAPW